MPPRTHSERSSWARIIVLVVLILFGLFWLWQRNSIEETEAPEPIGVTPPTNETATPLDISTLEASAANISIPDFEKAL